MQRGRPGVPLLGDWSLSDAVRGEWQILAPCRHVRGGGPAWSGQSLTWLSGYNRNHKVWSHLDPHCQCLGPDHSA